MKEEKTNEFLKELKDLPNFPLLKEVLNILPICHEKMINYMKSDLPLLKNDIPRINNKIIEIKKIIEIFEGKWLIDILFTVSVLDKAYFNDIKKSLPSINPRTLSSRLKHLESKGLIDRNILNTSPVRIYYSLTILGRDLFSFLIMIHMYMENRSEFKFQTKPPIENL